jgi:hypothetical protein
VIVAPGQVVEAEQRGDDAAHVEALLAAGQPQPSSRSSMSRGSSAGTLASAAETTGGGQVVGAHVREDPLNARPMGERAVATMTASGTGAPRSGPTGGQRTTDTERRSSGPGSGLRGRQLGRIGAPERRAAADQRQPAAQPGQPPGALLAGQRVDLDPGLAGGHLGGQLHVLDAVADRHADRDLHVLALQQAGQQGVGHRPVAVRGRVEAVVAPQVRLERKSCASRSPRETLMPPASTVATVWAVASRRLHSAATGAQRLHDRLDGAEVGQVPTTTCAPACRSVATARDRSRAGRGDRHPVRDVVGPDDDHGHVHGSPQRRGDLHLERRRPGAGEGHHVEVDPHARSRAMPPASSAPGVWSAESQPSPRRRSHPSTVRCSGPVRPPPRP